MVVCLALYLHPLLLFDPATVACVVQGWNTWCTDDACGLLDYCNEQEVRLEGSVTMIPLLLSVVLPSHQD
jgi:hypothetical protein